jgi:hypothetical protein
MEALFMGPLLPTSKHQKVLFLNEIKDLDYLFRPVQ